MLSALAIAVMACSGLLLGWTINVLSRSIDSGLTFTLVLASVFLYVAGASWMGRIVVRGGEYWKFGGFHNGITFALLVVGVGVLLLCLNAGMLPGEWAYFLISWPMLLFVLGCGSLCKIHYVPGIIMASIGTFFLVQRFPGGSFDGQFFATWWPVFIIIGGGLIFFSILLKPKQFLRGRHHHPKGNWEDNHLTTKKENSDGTINYKLVFSGMEQVILDPVFKGGMIETVFGGMELDLRHTTLPEGETYLYVKAVFGGVEIKMLDDWFVEIRSESVFGGVTDDRSKMKDMDRSKKLIIVANAVFGGVTIK
jgi:predicted membrane protein